MPLPIALAHSSAAGSPQVRKNGTLAYLRPDGKSQVTVEYEYGKPVRVDTVVISTQHDAGREQEQIQATICEQVVIKPIVPAELMDDDTKYPTSTRPAAS